MKASLPERLNLIKEANVIDMTGKPKVLLEERYYRFCFVGGSVTEYSAYFAREDVQNLWTWKLAKEVKCFGCFVTVAKKTEGQQRKLLVQVPFNYMMTSVRQRVGLGMDGGRALARLICDGAGFHCAACDQSNSFTSVIVPEWMIEYQGTPPLVANRVWHVLPASLRFEASAPRLG